VGFLPVSRVPSIALGHQVNFDLSSDLALLTVVAEPISAIVHLAAAVPMSEAYPDTEQSADLTRRIDANVSRAAWSWDCPVIYASTCGLYDRKKGLKREDDESHLDAATPYLLAKLAGESVFLEHDHTVIMRLAAPIGPGQRKSSIVSRFMAAARSGQEVGVWGSGERQQNFVDVSDIAAFVIQALERQANGIFNLACARPTSMMDLAHAVVEAVGSGTVVLPGIPDPLDSDTALYDVSRARDLLGWEAGVTLLESLENIVGEEFRA
jgi:nucleoside-diphosphate-sugar epimerase